LLTQLNDQLEEALEDRQTVTTADPGQAGVIGQILVEVIAEMGE
jgi:hypothetical protein